MKFHISTAIKGFRNFINNKIVNYKDWVEIENQ